MEIKLYLLVYTARTPSDVQRVCLYGLSSFPVRIVCAGGLNKSKQRNSIVRVASIVERTSSEILQIVHSCMNLSQDHLNPLTPNDPYRGRTAPLTSKHCILYIYSTNIGTEYFKHGIYSPFFLFKMQFVS